MKQVFYYDQASKQLTRIGIVDDNADLPDNATFVQPQDGLFDPLTWTGTTWVGITREEWLVKQPAATPVAPTTDQKFQAQLALQMATLQKNQAEFNAQVLLQVADIKNASATPVIPESATPVAEVTTVTPAASSTMGFKCPQGEPGQIGLQDPKGDSVTPVASTASTAPATPEAPAVETK